MSASSVRRLLRSSSILALLALSLGARPLAAAPGVVDPDTEVAQRHFRLGSELYGQEKYLEAIEQFERARQAKPVPAFEFNIARSYDRLGRWSDAIASYERYLTSAGHPPDEADVRARIELLRQRLPSSPVTTPTPAPVSPASPTVAASPPPRAAAPLHVAAPATVAGLVALSLAGGGALYGLVDRDFDRLEARCAPSCDRGEVNALRRREAASVALLGIAGASLVVDVVLWTVWAKRRPARSR